MKRLMIMVLAAVMGGQLCASLSDGLVSWYKFDGDTTDSSGNGHHLKNLGEAVCVEGRKGDPSGAYRFSGSNASRLANGECYCDLTNTFSCSLWFKTSVTMAEHGSSPTYWNPGNDIIHGANQSEASGVGVGLRVGSDGVAVVEHANGYRPTVLTYSTTIDSGWHHAVYIVENGGAPILYLDGKYVATGSDDGRRKIFAFEAIGGGAWGNYTGDIDEMRVYNRVLSAEEVKSLYEDVGDGLVARYEFSGSLADSTGHGYTLHSNKAESYVADRFGKAGSAYWLDGSTALFESETTAEVRLDTNYTFSCWFKASEETGLVDVKSSGIWGTRSTIKYLCGHSDYPIAIGTNGINVFEHASYFLPAVFRYDADLGTSWHHISFTVATNVEAMVYLDGQQIGSFAKIRQDTAATLGLGRYDGGVSGVLHVGLGAFCYGGHFAGGVDEARFYNRPLSAAEVKAVYDSERVKTYYVNGTTGSDENPGTSPEMAKKTIQAAIDVSMDGDTILVAPGTYAPIATHNKAILVRGMEGARSTFIDGGNTKTCAIMWQNGDPGSSLSRRSTVEGFTLQNGCAGDDMAAAAERGCVTRCIIRYCHGGGYSGACGCRCCTVVDTLAYANSYGSSEYGCWGGGVMMNSDTINCTIVNNQGYGLWDTTSWNTISWNNMYEGQVKDFYVSYGCEGKLNYCLTKTSIGAGEGNVTGTPQFFNAAENDYRLAEGSIGIDVGDNAHVTNTTDLDGNVRIWNDIVDIGCYEYGSYPPLEAGLVAWYRLDGDTKDSSGCKNDLTNNGAIATLDRHGRANGAMYLDGNSCISAIDDKIVLAKESGTLAGWFKAENAIEYFYPESTSGTYYSAPYAFMPSSGGWVSEQYWLWAGVGFALGTNGVMVYEHTGVYLPTPLVYKGNIGNGWIHVCITYYDNGEESLYINGCFIKSGLKSTKSKYIGFSPKDDGPAGIGGGGYGHFTGSVDDIRIYERTLSAAEVKALYDSERPKLLDGLVAHYEFNGNAKDSSGYGNDGVVHGATLTTDRFGKENGAYKFDGNDWIEAANSVSLQSVTNTMTFSAWVKLDASSIKDWIPMLCKGAQSRQFGFLLARNAIGDRIFINDHYGTGSGQDVYVNLSRGSILPDVWCQYVATYDGREMKGYIDGVCVGTVLVSDSFAANDSALYLGKDIPDATEYINGLMDDVRIYNRVLTAEEVKAVYDSEKPPVRVWTVSFDARGGVASKDTMVVTNNMAIGELPTAERDGHKFLGWYSAIEGGTQVTPETIITNDVTFYAHWFDTSIGNVTGATNVLWRTGGDVPWATEETAEGWDVRSGAIDKNSETWVECVVTNGCRVAFQWKVSCEPEDEGEMYDFLSFSIDGEPKAAICGEVGWTNDVFCVSGAGEHVLRWTYQKDNRTSAGEDCGWLGRVRVDPEVPVTFKDNGATSGAVPTIPTAYLGDTITIPGKGTLAKSCHAFGGWEYGETTYPEGAAFTLGTNAVEFVAVWNAKVLGLPILVSPATPHVTTEKIAVSLQTPASAQGIRYTIDGTEPTAESAVYVGPFEIEDRGVTVKAVAFADDWFDSACATWELTRAPWSAAECLNAETREFSFGGNADWVRDLSVTHDGEAAMRSGTISDKQTSQILMPVTGEGTVSFWCKVSSEWDPGTKEVYDGLAIAIDGKDVYPGLIGGEVDWTNITVGVSGAGEHVICWRYQKDKVSSAGSDCAWIDEVLWQVNETVVPAAITGDRDLPISRSWIEKDLVDRYGPGKTQAFRDKFGNDYDLAVLMPNGKTMGGNPGYVWEDYIAGTDPTDTNSVFAASISMEGGVPKVIWTPDLGEEREYKVWGKESLIGGDWQYPTNSLHRFFKVSVEMP